MKRVLGIDLCGLGPKVQVKDQIIYFHINASPNRWMKQIQTVQVHRSHGVPVKFEVATSNGLGGGASTSRYILSLTFTSGPRQQKV